MAQTNQKQEVWAVDENQHIGLPQMERGLTGRASVFQSKVVVRLCQMADIQGVSPARSTLSEGV